MKFALFLLGSFFFFSSFTFAAEPPEAIPVSAEDLLWVDVQQSKKMDDLALFFRIFPDSKKGEKPASNSPATPERTLEDLESIEKKAQANDAYYQALLGAIYWNGARGKDVDRAAAEKWIRKAAEKKHPVGQYYLAQKLNYLKKKLWAEAYPNMQKLAATGDIDATCLLGDMLYNGWGAQRNAGTGLKHIWLAAERGGAYCRYLIGELYLEGADLPENGAKAMRWFELAGGDFTPAVHELGLLYESGTGVAKDESKATGYFQKGADRKYDASQVSLGLIYKTGTAKKQDYAKARALFKSAADNGNPEAENQMGLFFENGWSVKKSLAEANIWFQRASYRGLTDGRRNLARINNAAKLLPAVYPESVKWYEEQAAEGDVDAQLNLAFMHGKGFGMDQDFDQARYWYEEAAKNASEAASAKIREMDKTGRAFFWEATSKINRVYLIGSLHMGTKTMYPLPKVVETAFGKSDVLVTEIHLDKKDRAENQQKFLFHSRIPIGDITKLLSADKVADLKKRFKKHDLSYERLRFYKPWFISFLLMKIHLNARGFHEEIGIDKHFQGKNGEENQETLETVDQQLALVDGMGDPSLFFEYNVTKIDDYDGAIPQTLFAWTNGDAKSMEKIVISDYLEKNPRLEPVFRKIFFERNKRMAVKIEGFLKTGKIHFIVVGAGHLVGERGILERLRQKGYEVNQL